MSQRNGLSNPLHSLAEASPVAMAVSEGESHVLRYVNPAFCRLYGRPAAELLGRAFGEVCPEESGAVKPLLDRVFQSGSAESLADLHREGSGSASTYWSYSAWPLPERGAVALQVTDTSEHGRAVAARLEEQQRVSQQLLLTALREDERSEQLLLADRSKDEFLAMLAHELRNPLAAIRTGIYLLDQRAGPQDLATHETCALLERQMRHLSRLLDDLLDVSRITRGKIDLHLEAVDVVQTLQHAAAASRALLEANRCTLELDLPAEPAWVEADAVRLEQVVTNLLQNALKYTDPGGQVSISLERAAGEAAPDRPAGPGSALIRVRDTGIGISPGALPHVFELFVQADTSLVRTRGGLGIGLTLVRRLVELHGGSVEAHSAGLGQGSEFRVLLPLREPAAGGDASPKGPTSSPSAAIPRGASILLVEDNVPAAVSLAKVLKLWGYGVRIAHSGEAGLAAAAAASPDVVLLDLGLPGMDGYEVARRLRAEPRLRATLLVALTGYGQDEDRLRTREAGFDHHLTKPADLNELRRILEVRPEARPQPPEV